MLLATALNIPPQNCEEPWVLLPTMTDKIRLNSFPADQPSHMAVKYAASGCFMRVFVHPLGILHLYTVHPHLLWGCSSSCGVLYLYPPHSSNKLPEKRGEAQPIMDHIVCLAISVSRTQPFNTFSIKYSLYPLALSSYVSWHFYQALKWFQPGWHSPWVRPIFLRDFQHVLEHFITASLRVTGDDPPASDAADQPVGPVAALFDWLS